MSAFTEALKSCIAASDLATVFVAGEISGWKVYPSGHAYFTLKDEGAVLNAVMFAGALARSSVRTLLKNGAKVKMWGQVDVYPPRGSYQLIVRQAWVDGEGALARRFEELKARLAAEGLFDTGRKRPLPYLPRLIGVVTASAGAVIHDICTVLQRRFPGVGILLKPVRVQGEGAASEIAEAINWFGRQTGENRPDVLIVGRGGGSAEELWAFNEEPVVRAVVASEIPIISAVGHETDFSLCDFAADMRAGTPSIAAEMAVRERAEIEDALADLRSRLVRAPQTRLEFLEQRLDYLRERVGSVVTRWYDRTEARVNEAKTRLEMLNPYAVLSRGYSLTTRADGKVVCHADDAPAGTELITRLADGSVRSVVM